MKDVTSRRRRPGRGQRWARLGAAAALVAVAVGSVGADRQLAEAASAAAPAAAPDLDGFEIVYGYSEYDLSSPKTATASCTGGKKVLGGGAFVSPAQGNRGHFTLLQLEPYAPGRNPADPLGYGYWVRAATTDPVSPDNWQVNAYAICADPWPGLHIVSHTTDFSSDSVQATHVGCPDGEHVLGTGARILPLHATLGDAYYHGIGLQVARTDALGRLTRARAHERPSGYYQDWRLRAIAVCTPTKPLGWMVATAESPGRDSEWSKQVYAGCPDLIVGVGFGQNRLRRQPISVGGAISDEASGHVTLQEVYPFSRRAWAGAFENSPTDEDWNFIVVRYICAVA